MTRKDAHTPKLESTAEIVSRQKMMLWGRFVLRASVVALAIGLGALYFRGLDLSTDLSYLDAAILSGVPEGQYHASIDKLVAAAAAQHGHVSNVTSNGSRDNLERLSATRKTCEVQFGLVQDGFDWASYPGLELIGRIGRTEAMLLLGRDADQLHLLSDLHGLKIGVGPERSGSAFLAQRLLEHASLSGLDVHIEHHPLKQQVELAASGELDLALFVMDEDAQLLQTAVRERGLQIAGLDHTEALARRFSYLSYGALVAGQFDPVRVLPPHNKPILRVDTLLLSNGCAEHSDVIGLMTLVSRAYPSFIDRNRTAPAPAGLPRSESAMGFFDNQGAEFADEHVPWLVDIMPPSNWVYTIMAVSLFFNLAGSINRNRLAVIDLTRVALENDLALLFGGHLSNDEIRHFDPVAAGRAIDPQRLDKLIQAYNRHLEKCRRQSLSVLSPLGEEMGYRDQEIIMTATLDALKQFRAQLEP